MKDNPFDALGLPTDAAPHDLTERLRERIEDAQSEAERVALRSAWEALTRNPEGRVELSIRAFPTGTRGPRPRPVDPRPSVTLTSPTEDELLDETPLLLLAGCSSPTETDFSIEDDPLLDVDTP